jgi:alkanesulfonate monooxygenase SsuD/methylene tetrahydromethanopterin reductase-like flavin-dependent oxidoreductase (luciferase family)
VRYSVNVANFGEFAAPEVFAKVARRAEEAGWDGLLVWDHVVEEKQLRRQIADPWILLAAAALATRRIKLGTAITPVARRRPVQRPRVPIWVGGVWPNRAPMRRAARWDGAIPVVRAGIETAHPPDVSEVRDLVAFLRGCRAENGLAERPFDIVVGGMSPAEPAAGRDLVGPLADLGITWWDERMPWGDALERAEPILRRIDQGPPRI